MKSAYELAMERLKAENPNADKPLSDEQKAEIAKINEAYEARVAEIRILKQSEINQARAAGDFEKVQVLEKQMAIDLRRAEEDRDAKKIKIRNQA